MILSSDCDRVGEFKNGIRDGFWTIYREKNITFEGQMKVNA